MLIPHQRLLSLAVRIITAAGSTADEAALVAEHLIAANLMGHDSHGIGMLPTYMKYFHAGKLKPNQRVTFASRSGVFAVVNGNKGYGQVIMREATDWAIGSARDQGIGIFTLRNSQHIGRVGAYGEQAAAAGMIAIFFVNVTSSPPRVAPFRGSDGRFSTNPVCIAIPRPGTDPIVLDFATSKVALGKVRVARNEGRRLAENIIIDSRGRPTTDPALIYQEPYGSVLPFGEHKGSGLALVCEIFGGALAGNGTIQGWGKREPGSVNGCLALVLDPARLIDMAWFGEEVTALVEHVKRSPPARADEPVLVAGEPERIARARRMVDGITVDAATWKELCEAAASVGVSIAADG